MRNEGLRRKGRSEDSWTLLYAGVGAASFIVFILIHGVRILDPEYTDWLMYGVDLPQHYLGWVAYRNSGWMFPIGMLDTLTWPDRMSVIFVDPIPLCAVFFKALSPVLPEKFQYFGWWGGCCFALQGVLTAGILKNFTREKKAVTAGALLLVLMPVMVMRMYYHTALASQWLLLPMLALLLSWRRYRGSRKVWPLLFLLGALAASIHIYLLAMNGILLLGILAQELWLYGGWKRAGACLFLYLTAAVLTIGALGGFSAAVQAGAGVVGWRMDLDALVNPMSTSCLLRDIPPYRIPGAEALREGYMYPGAGLLLGMLFAGALLCMRRTLREEIRGHWREAVCLLAVAALALLLALSPEIALGDRVLFTWSPGESIKRLWSVFRATGRFGWIALYLLTLCSLIVLLRALNGRTLLIVLSFLLALQIFDLHRWLWERHERYAQPIAYESPLADRAFWEILADKKEIRHVLLASSFDMEEQYALAAFALENHMTVNTFYIERMDPTSAQTYLEEALSAPSPENLFIFSAADSGRCAAYDLNYYEADGYIVGYAGEIE